MRNMNFNDVYKLGYENEIPISITVELLTKCNFDCKHCYIPEHVHEGLSKEALFKLFEELKELGTLDLNLTGGEIFLRKDIMEIIRKARELGFSVSLLSNGSLITESIAKELQELHIKTFSITLFSMNNRTNDRITGIESSWKQVMKGIEILTKYGVTVDLKTPILSDNTMDFIEVHEYCVENDFQFTASSTLFPKTDGDKTPLDFVVGKKQIFDCVSKLDQIIKFRKLNLKMKDLCSLLKYSMFIDADGNVFPCDSFFLTLGNLKDTKIRSIWESEEAKRIRNLKRDLNSECGKCDVIEYCSFCPRDFLSGRRGL